MPNLREAAVSHEVLVRGPCQSKARSQWPWLLPVTREKLQLGPHGGGSVQRALLSKKTPTQAKET